MVYTESELIIPALKFLRKKPEGLNTTQLIRLLTNAMKPTGKDARIITGRRDTYFSQKVRNLTGSHRTLDRRRLATFESGISKITKKGLKYLEKSEPVLLSLEIQGFSKSVIRRQAEQDYSQIIIEEGTVDERTVEQRKRSAKLRKIAITEFKKGHGGKIFCETCRFDFSRAYGNHGKGFIEIHHTKPVHQVDLRGRRTKLPKALEEVVLLCSNCHRMVHRRKNMLSISELKSIIRNQN